VAETGETADDVYAEARAELGEEAAEPTADATGAQLRTSAAVN
jgi:hypothetical protein